MSLIPIKLLKNKANRDKLLKIKDETDEIDKDDFIESRINTNSRAKNLLAIEDASESTTFIKRGSLSKLPKIYRKSLVKSSNTSSERPVRCSSVNFHVQVRVRVLIIC
jgi:hypothetical protein